jgi:hypothetical protein
MFVVVRWREGVVGHCKEPFISGEGGGDGVLGSVVDAAWVIKGWRKKVLTVSGGFHMSTSSTERFA